MIKENLSRWTIGEIHDIEGASLAQRLRVALAAVGIGDIMTRLVVQAEIDERYAKETGPLGEVSPKDLLKLLRRIHTAGSSEERYTLLAQPIDKNQENVWFDAIPGLTAPEVNYCVARAAADLLPSSKPYWQNAADLGAGTGKLSALLGGYDANLPRLAEKITAVDRSKSLLDVSASRYGADINYVVGDVTSMPFTDASFDLIVSGGLVYSLGYEHQDSYFKEISRLLQRDGIYIDGDHAEPSQQLHSYRTRKGELAWLIFQNIARERGDPLAGIDESSYFAAFELQLLKHNYEDAESGAKISVRILQKT